MSAWTAVVPVEPLALGSCDPLVAEAMVLSMLDLLRGSDAVASVLVVTGDLAVAGAARRRGMSVMAVRPMLSTDPLNDAARAGVRWAGSRRCGDAVVVVPVDLPHLTVPQLDVALEALAERPRAFVPHADGRGVTLVSTQSPSDFEPHYGPRAAREFSRAGHAPVVGLPLPVRGGEPAARPEPTRAPAPTPGR